MTSRDFCYWAQGFFEMADPKKLTEAQINMFRAHLNLVFMHEIDPSYSNDPKIQKLMTEVHNEGKAKPQAGEVFEIKPSWPHHHNDDNTLLRC